MTNEYYEELARALMAAAGDNPLFEDAAYAIKALLEYKWMYEELNK